MFEPLNSGSTLLKNLALSVMLVSVSNIGHVCLDCDAGFCFRYGLTVLNLGKFAPLTV